MPPKRKADATDSDASQAPLTTYSDEDLRPSSDSDDEENFSDASVSKRKCKPAGEGRSAPAGRCRKASTSPQRTTAAQTPKGKKTKDPNHTPRKYIKKVKSSVYSSMLLNRYRDKWLTFPCRDKVLAAYESSSKAEPIQLDPTFFSTIQSTAMQREQWMKQRNIKVVLPPVAVDCTGEGAAATTAAGTAVATTTANPFPSSSSSSSSSTSCRLPAASASPVMIPTLGCHEVGELDVLINSGGPVSSIAIAPRSGTSIQFVVGLSRLGWPSEEDYEVNQSDVVPGTLGPRFHLQTTTGGHGLGSDYLRNLGMRESHDNLLQVWSSSNQTTELCYEVELQRKGSVVGTAFLPQAGHVRGAIGLLAVACGNGNCLLFVLPECSPKIQGKVLPEAAVKVLEIAVAGAMVMCASFAFLAPHDLCLGLSDGSVGIFSIHPPAHGKPWQHQLLQRLDDFSSASQAPSLFTVCQAQICPYDARLVASVSADCSMRIWKRTQPHRPLFLRKYFSSLRDCVWDRLGFGIYFADAEEATLFWERLWAQEATNGKRTYVYPHSVTYGMIFKITHLLHDGQSVVFSGASDGTVRGGYVSTLGSGKPPQDSLIQCLAVLSVQATPAPKVVLSLGPTVLDGGEVSNSSHVDAEAMTRHAQAVATIDSVAGEDEGDALVLAIGMACGLVRVHSVNPRTLLVGDE